LCNEVDDVPEKKDTIVARLVLERDYLTQEQLDDALETQRKARDDMGMDIPLLQMLQNKHLLTPDQIQEIRNAASVETGEARLVAGYEVVSKLGQGGMGAVYKAKSQTTGQFVALKVLPPSLATPELVKRFEREAKVVSSLDHQHIVGCVEFGYDKRRKVHFCALELVDGEDLDRRISALSTIPEKEAVRITMQVAEALQHAFYNGLLHRDIKPANIMVTTDGAAKLLDLGLAREANAEVTRLTQTGAFVGSPYYASPEQATGSRDIDIRSDIYSLGCTLYHMVTGKPPFSGTTVLQVLQKHLTEKMPWPQEVNPDLSEGICRIIAKMMAKSPADRYQDPNELLADIDTHLEGGEPEITEEALKGSSVNVPVVVRKRLRERRRAARPSRESRRSRSAPRGKRRSAGDDQPERQKSQVGMMVGIGAVVVIVLGMGVAMLTGKKRPRERPPASPSTPETPAARPGRKSGDDTSGEAQKRAMAYQRAAGEALGKAREFEEQNPHLRSQVIEKYQSVVRKFPATPAAKEAAARFFQLKRASPGYDEQVDTGNQPAPQPTGVVTAKAPSGVDPRARSTPSELAEAPAGIDLARGLVGWWKFDEKAGKVGRDSSGRGNDGAIRGARWVDGRLGGALEFDGKDDIVVIANESAFDIHDKITVAAWVKVTGGWRGIWQAFVTKNGEDGKGWQLRRHGSTDKVCFTVRGTGGGEDVTGADTTVGTDGLWHHIVGVFDGSRRKVYLDGKPYQDMAGNGSPIGASDDPVAIGGRMRGRGPESLHRGAVDDVRIYARALSADEVAALARAAGRPETAPGTPQPVVHESAQPPPQPDVYLSDLKPLKSVAGWGGPPKMDRSIQGKPLRVNGLTFAKGIGTHAHSEIVFALGPAWRRFVASAGCDDESSGSIVFEVHSDATLLARSRVMLRKQIWHFDVAVPVGSRELRLVVTDGGNGISNDHADWLNAGFVTGAPPAPPAAAKAPAGIDLTRGLVGWWKFDEGDGTVARDSSGKRSHGRLIGDLEWGKGRIGGALSFGGTRDRVEIMDSPSISVTGDLTVTAWVNGSSWRVNNIVSKDFNSSYRFRVQDNGNALWLLLCDDYGYEAESVELSNTLRTGKWYHVAATADLDAKEVRFYLDGAQMGEARSTTKAGIQDMAGPLLIGKTETGFSEDFHGLMDDVRIYNRALSAEEIRLLAEPERLAAMESNTNAETKVAEALTDFFGVFDALIAKGDFTGARKHAEQAARKAGADRGARVFQAAARVAKALEERAMAVRRGAETLVGKDVKLATTMGAQSGRATKVTGAGVVLKIKKTMRGMGSIETSVTVKWSDLTPEDEAKLAGEDGWEAESSDDHVALALLARARKDERSALAALRAAGDHPLAAHIREKMAEARRERSARLAWSGIRAKARMKKLSSTKSRALLESIEEFKRKHGGTEFAASIADELAELRLRAWKLGRPGLLGTYFADKEFQKPVLRRIDPQVNFKWKDKSPGHGVPKDNFSVRWEGFIVPPSTGRYYLHLCADDKARLSIGDRETLSVKCGQGFRASEPTTLRADDAVPVKLEHVEHGSLASLEFFWTGPGIPEPVPVPTECLRPPVDYENLPGPPITE